jgi:acetyl-CoA acetyltransferase family protein
MDLGVHVVKATVRRLSLSPSDIEEFIFGTVLVDPRASNFAREIIFRSGLPRSITAHAVSNNCISGLVAATMLAEGIQSGRIKGGLAGGSESMSRPTLTLSPKGEDWFLGLARARTTGQKLQKLLGLRPKYLFPQAPSPKEPSTGLTMGQHCEITAKEFKISRSVQDAIALRSHQRAAAAQKSGFLSEEIEALGEVAADNFIRADTTLEKLGALKPAFDRSPAGTLTAGNSSGLTDGASVVCLMAESLARAQGREILGFIRATEYASIAPDDGLLMAPAVALPRLLAKQRLTVGDIDCFEVHEAFAAQVAANMASWEKGWPKVKGADVIGAIPEEKWNVNGGSIAIGHPFAATGGRLILSALNHLKRTNKKRAAISVCAAGAMACAMLLERE